MEPRRAWIEVPGLPTRPGRTRVGWIARQAPDRTAGRALALDLAQDLLDDPGRVSSPIGGPLTLVHACPGCGSDSHGRPVVRAGHLPVGIWISLSHNENWSLAAASTVGPIGVDLASADARPADRIARHRDDDERDPVRLWIAKEAITKALGTGLTLDPAGFPVIGSVARPRGPAGPSVRLRPLAAGDLLPGQCAALAIVEPGLGSEGNAGS